MFLSVNFSKHHPVKPRVYYDGMGNQHGHTYCVEEGIWFICSRDGEPESLLEEGTELTIYDETGLLGNTTIKGTASHQL
jgi:hypothetical protein